MLQRERSKLKMLLLWTLIFLIFLFIFQWYWRRRAFVSKLMKLPGTPPSFLIGNVLWMMKLYTNKLPFLPPVYIFERMIGNLLIDMKTGARVFWFGMKPIVNVFRAEILETVLNSNVSLEKSFEYRFLQQWLGLGLLTSHGSKWKTRRRLLTPTLHFRILETYLSVFHNQSMYLIEKIRSMSNEDWIDIKPHVILCTLDIVCETVMGVSIGAQKGSNSEYVNAVHNLGGLFTQRTVHPWLQSDTVFRFSRTGRDFAKDVKILHDFTEKVIKEKKQSLLKERSSTNTKKDKEDSYFGKKRETFMDLLLNLHIDGESLSEEDIREEVDTFMFEGHDTTAMGIIFALYCIGLHPSVQEKINAELHDTFGDDKNRQATQDELRNMKYLECVLKESQRLFPSVPLIGRNLNEDIHFDGFTIPKGTTLHMNFYVLHRNPEVFHNPEKFDPDRFLPENSLNRHPYAYIPFSAGPRNCIGQKFAMLEEKIIISNILRNFEVISIDPRDKLQLIIEFTLRITNPVRIKFIPKN